MLSTIRKRERDEVLQSAGTERKKYVFSPVHTLNNISNVDTTRDSTALEVLRLVCWADQLSEPFTFQQSLQEEKQRKIGPLVAAVEEQPLLEGRTVKIRVIFRKSFAFE